MSQSVDAPRDGLRDGLRDAPRDVPHTTPHHTTPFTSTSSRGMALAAIVESIRPDWSHADIVKALRSDDRPWRTVVAAAVLGACDPNTRTPNGLRYVNATSGATSTPTPPPLAHVLHGPTCDHGAPVSPPCALCRKGVPA